MSALRRITAIILTISMLAFNWSKLNILISFKIHQEYIAKVLCINKEKPQLQCNGKCHLKKELKKDEERKQKQTTVHEGFQMIFSPIRQSILQSAFRQQNTIDSPYSQNTSLVC